ncbi:hypothetical protein C8R43DRAFT_1121543 [Mycena crocata]|nr:hypothetical protein C8R43DRAFT_1121543 [Mycena crocata]
MNSTLITDINTDVHDSPVSTSDVCPACHKPTLTALFKSGGKDVLYNWARYLQVDSAKMGRASITYGTALQPHLKRFRTIFRFVTSRERRWLRPRQKIQVPSFSAEHQIARTVETSLTVQTRSAAGLRFIAQIAAELLVDVPFIVFALGTGPLRVQQAQILASTRVVEDAKLKEVEANTFNLSGWRTDGQDQPEHFRLVADNFKFVPEKYPAVMKFAVNGIINILDSFSPPQWRNHDVRASIPITSDSHIFFKTPAVTYCTGFDEEISRFPSPPISLSSSAGITMVSAAPVPMPSASDTQVGATAVPKFNKFPRKYTCDMVDGMALLAPLSGKSSIQKGFEEVFSGAKYIAPTVYKHIRFYIEGVKHGLVQSAASRGRTPDGCWNKVTERVSAMRYLDKLAPVDLNNGQATIDLTHGRATADDIQNLSDVNVSAVGTPPNTIIYDDGVSHVIKSMRMLQFKMTDGILADHWDDSPPLQVTIFEHFILGSKFWIQLGNFSVPGSPQLDCIAVAIKECTGTASRLVWIEGARLADCHSLWESFKKALSAGQVQIPNIEVVDTRLFMDETTSDLTITQPWYHGNRLDANNYNTVYVDFEGLITPAGYRITDSRTHVMDPDRNQHGMDFMGSLGVQGVQNFRDGHNCNAICGSLRLNPFPLPFP